MSIWRVKPIKTESVVKLTHWQVFSIPSLDGEGRDRHLNGSAAASGDPGRVSSRIVSFDFERMVGTTRSGRKYQLVGPPGRDAEADYVWEQWSRFNKVDPKKVVNVTSKYEK